MCDRRRDLRSIASEVGISFGTGQSIQTNILGMSKVLARWVPRMLTDDQKRTWLDISKYLLSRYEDDPGDFIEKVVTQDETWVHDFDPESKMQSKQLTYSGSSRRRTFKRVHLAGKVMASILWDSQAMIIIDYLQQCNIIIDVYYAGELWALTPGNCKKEPGKTDLRCNGQIFIPWWGRERFDNPSKTPYHQDRSV